MSFERNPYAVTLEDSFEPEITGVHKIDQRSDSKQEFKKDVERLHMPTIFDVEKYFIDTNRAHFVYSVGELNTKIIEDALMNDLDKAQNPEERMKLRALIQVASTNGFLRSEITKEEMSKLTHGRIRSLHWEYMRMAEAGDDVEREEYLLNGWRRIAVLLSSKNEVMDDEEMLFIEELLREMSRNLKYFPNSRTAQDIYWKLRKIRTAMYWKAFMDDRF